MPVSRSSERAERLLERAQLAGQVRRAQTDPDVVALSVERVRAVSWALAWAGVVLGLGFTLVNVQRFGAQGAPAWSGEWVAAWLLDPMVSLVLISVLLAEHVTARYQVDIGFWPRTAKWFALTATYVMNTWSAWAVADPALIVLHSVPPLLVLMAVEAAPAMRERLTESAFVAERISRERYGETARARGSDGDPPVESEWGDTGGVMSESVFVPPEVATDTGGVSSESESYTPGSGSGGSDSGLTGESTSTRGEYGDPGETGSGFGGVTLPGAEPESEGGSGFSSSDYGRVSEPPGSDARAGERESDSRGFVPNPGGEPKRTRNHDGLYAEYVRRLQTGEDEMSGSEMARAIGSEYTSSGRNLRRRFRARYVVEFGDETSDSNGHGPSEARGVSDGA